MNGLAASRPAPTTSSVGAVRPAFTRSQVASVEPASTIMIATSPPARTRPATTIEKVASFSWSTVGKHTHWSPMRLMRTPPIGPLKGRPEIWVDIDAALMATTSYSTCGLRARTVMTTWTSLRSPFLNAGRSGRSMRRQARMAPSDGRPSRRKNEPGMRPTAYIFSSTSTVSGKKSMDSRGVFWAVVALSSMVSPSR